MLSGDDTRDCKHDLFHSACNSKKRRKRGREEKRTVWWKEWHKKLASSLVSDIRALFLTISSLFLNTFLHFLHSCPLLFHLITLSAASKRFSFSCPFLVLQAEKIERRILTAVPAFLCQKRAVFSSCSNTTTGPASSKHASFLLLDNVMDWGISCSSHSSLYSSLSDCSSHSLLLELQLMADSRSVTANRCAPHDSYTTQTGREKRWFSLTASKRRNIIMAGSRGSEGTERQKERSKFIERKRFQ